VLYKAKQRCVMGVGMCLYAQLVQTKNKQCKSAIILQCYHPHLSDFCSRPRLTQPYNHMYNISWCCQNLSSLLLKVSVVSADITISGKLFHTFTILDAKEKFFLNHSDIYHLLLLLLVCVSFTIIGQPRNSVLIRRV